jgi:glycosyltransferase involved in cell wall biosynthesis
MIKPPVVRVPRPSHQPRPGTRSPQLIAVMTAYNVAATIAGVLERLYPLVDRLLIVDDGSTDSTREVVFGWLEDKPHAHLISFNRNRGMSAAYYAAFSHLRTMVDAGQIAEDDVVLTVDADGQHDPASLDLLLRPIAAGADAVIARRDFRLYPLYKRLGNWVMSAWASIWSGRRFQDVESGYRAFRVGPLLEALRYYKGYKYSETVEVAVILPLLGYRVHDTTLVDIPVFRSRTRMKDVIIDLVAMPCAWWRVMATRRLPAGIPRWLAYYGLPLVFAALLLPVLVMLSRSIYLANDTVNNYAHVWYISQSIFDTGRIPIHFAGLDNGHAFTFPYGLAPWTANALVYPLMGDWSVTLFLVLAGMAVVAGAAIVRPAMRDPWLLLLFIANPFFIDALAGGQYSFLWATAAFFGVVWCVERRRWALAAIAMWLAASTHPIEGGMAVGAYMLFCLAYRPALRPPLLAASAVALAALTPFIYFALRTPALSENSASTILISIAQDLPRRGLVMAAPFVLSAAAPMFERHYRSAGVAFLGCAAVAVALSSGFASSTALASIPGVRSVSGEGSYYGMRHRATDDFLGYMQSADFGPHVVYRVLSPNDREQGSYMLLRHHAVLSNEFFSESQKRHSWNESTYQCYLAAKHIDRVAVERGYESEFKTNEQALLDMLTQEGLARVTYSRRNVTVYDVTAFRDSRPAPASISACGAI